MKRVTIVLAGLFAAMSAMAQGYGNVDSGVLREEAEVLSAQPRIERVLDRTESCYMETEQIRVQPAQEHSATGAVVGALAGGILGNQVGKGTGRAVATGLGVVIGAGVGDHLGNQGSAPSTSAPRQVRRCTPVESYREVVKGYDVTYRFMGRTFRTVTAQDPGRYMAVDVRVSPAGNSRF